MESRRHMLDGIARMNEGDWLVALRHFDRAVELREATPWRESVESAWVLAAAWINRSDVLRFLGQPDEAIRSLDRAIDAMGFVPFAENPGYVNRLILAWINRGTACGEIARLDEALAGFSKAEELLETRAKPLTQEQKLMASMLHANRARMLLELGRTMDGWRDSQLAMSFLEGLEPVAVVTESAIKARGIHCHALALLLDEPGGADLPGDWIARATDATEEALALVRSSGYRGIWVADLVRYGARIYRICQPHFLGEFIHEWLTADGPLAENDGLKREMSRELLLAKEDLEKRVQLHAHDTEWVERAIQTLRSLQMAESALKLKVR